MVDTEGKSIRNVMYKFPSGGTWDFEDFLSQRLLCIVASNGFDGDFFYELWSLFCN